MQIAKETAFEACESIIAFKVVADSFSDEGDRGAEVEAEIKVMIKESNSNHDS